MEASIAFFRGFMLPTCIMTPEEVELHQKISELTGLQQKLAEKELLLSTCRSNLNFFEKEYNRAVGSKYSELDRLRAQVLEFVSSMNPAKGQLRIEAETARKHAEQTEYEIGHFGDTFLLSNQFDPSEESCFMLVSSRNRCVKLRYKWCLVA